MDPQAFCGAGICRRPPEGMHSQEWTRMDKDKEALP